ncbi:MAG: hypothetical protein AAB356_07220, partial [Deltaproteobacteria bacterium]
FVIFSLAFACMMKIQAVTFLPILFFYYYQQEVFSRTFKQTFIHSRAFGKSLFFIFGSYLVTNIYLLHPVGFLAFKTAFIDNIVSNATNHGSSHVVSFSEKMIQVIQHFYVSEWMFLFFFFVILILIFRKSQDHLFRIIALTFLLNGVYLLFFVNKAWQHYYLPVIFSGMFLVPLLLRRYIVVKYRVIFILLLVSLQLGLNYPYLQKAFSLNQNNALLEMNKNMNREIVHVLSHQIKRTDHFLISPNIGFPFRELGLVYQNITTISGPITLGMIDAAAYEMDLEKRYGQSSIASFRKNLEVSYIILSKRDVYFDAKRLGDMQDQDGYKRSIELLQQLKNRSIGYEEFYNSDSLI